MQKTKSKKIIPLTFDVMFTEIFNDPDNICILEEFIAGYFDYPLESVRGNIKLLSRRLQKEDYYDSRKEVDLLLEFNGKKINIEMSNSQSIGIRERNIVYLAKLHGRQLKKGDSLYADIGETIQIIFYNVNNQKELVNTWYLRDISGEIYSKKMRIDTINVVRGKEMCYTDNKRTNYLIAWCKVMSQLDYDNLEKITKRVLTAKSNKKFLEHVDTLSGDEKMVKLYTKLSRRQMEFNTIEYELNETRKLIAEKEQEVSEKEQEISAKEQEVSEKEQEVSAKEQEVSAKEQEVSAKEQEVSAKEQEVSEKEQEISAKEQEVSVKEQEIAKQTKLLEEKERKLDEKLRTRNIEIAKEMLHKGINLEIVKEITSLSQEEIDNLN